MDFLTVLQVDEYVKEKTCDDRYIDSITGNISSNQPEIVRYLCSTEINRFNETELAFLILCGMIIYDIFTHFHGDVSFVSPRQLKGIEEDNINTFCSFLEGKSNGTAELMKMLSEKSDEPNIILVPVQFYQGFRHYHKHDLKPENYIFSLMHFKTVIDALSLNSRKKFFRDRVPEKMILSPEERSNMIENFSLQNYAGYYNYSAETRDFGRKVGRNEPCPCGSGKKFKKCCGEEK